MIASKVYWVGGPWPGKLAIAARPRGGEWLEDEIADWERHGVKTVLSLLTTEEQQELDLENESAEAKAHGMVFWAYAIRDREVPDSENSLTKILEQVDKELSSGRNVIVHCRQGIG